MTDALIELTHNIEKFLASSGMTPTEFGRTVLNDPNFVFDLRAGTRSPSIRTVEKIYAYLDGQTKKPKAVSVPSQGPRTFTDAAAAVEYVRELYDANVTHLRTRFQ